MGLNVDLRCMLGLPETMKCPKCGNVTEQNFDDYDIECGNPNPEPGVWEIDCYCRICEHNWEYRFEVQRKTHEENMSLNKYFTFIKDEDQLDKDFEQELKDNPLAITRETARFFREEMKATLDHFRCRRLARLLYFLLETVKKQQNELSELRDQIANYQHPGALSEKYKDGA